MVPEDELGGGENSKRHKMHYENRKKQKLALENGSESSASTELPLPFVTPAADVADFEAWFNTKGLLATFVSWCCSRSIKTQPTPQNEMKRIGTKRNDTKRNEANMEIKIEIKVENEKKKKRIK
eukprot:gnl/MRDRNA2_/MRDRNA2_53195_c0_seq1.p1 gnl/MRDRNA2_/MRDRNA2_53195_c0~~gnl/MRDRNA2_/MRDRNA2_53195_c0_seq1.p1  ORF type:complete len:143 (-),score=25.29 gnl/MRDRNA2_/MRDRNA2_53195_c0_seq1:47-418(-)